jgi:hypothetical protein
MDFIQQQEPPFPTLQKVHELFGRVGSCAGVCDHAVYGNDDSSCAFSCAGELRPNQYRIPCIALMTYWLGRLRRKDGNLLVTDIRKLDKLLLPLLGRDAGGIAKVSDEPRRILALTKKYKAPAHSS